MPSPAGHCKQRGLRLSGSVREEVHFYLSDPSYSPFLKTIRLVAQLCWSSIFHLFTTLLENKMFPTVPIDLILVSFNDWPLVPLLFFPNINKCWSPIIDIPSDIFCCLCFLLCCNLVAVKCGLLVTAKQLAVKSRFALVRWSPGGSSLKRPVMYWVWR